MAARKQTGKETRTERQEREAIQEFGSIVCPSMAASEVVAYTLIPGSGSRYRVYLADGSKQEVSRARLLLLTHESIACEAVA
jgi:hypothetical protein